MPRAAAGLLLSFAAVAGGGLGLLMAFRALRGAVSVVAVEGGSMAPALRAGDWLLVESVSYRRRLPRAGEVVVAPDPRDPRRELIKRASPTADGRALELRGDAVGASTDSRTFGPLAPGDVKWRAIFRYRPVARAGLIR